MQVAPINQNINNKYDQASFKARTFDGDSVSALKNLWLKETESQLSSRYPILKKFNKTFKNETQARIQKSFMSCLNSDGTVSKDAIRILFALCGQKSPYFFDRIKQLFSHKEISKCFVYKCSVYTEELKNVADIIEACKNNNGFHEKENLLLAEDMQKTQYGKGLTINAVNIFKDKNGIVTEENRAFYEYLRTNYPQNFGRLITALPDKNNNVSESVKNFVIDLNGSTVVNSGRFKQSDYIIDVLEHTQNTENRDEILNFILSSEDLKTDCPSMRYYIDKDGNISLDHLKKYLEISSREDIKDFKVPAYIYQSDNPEILDKNIEQLKRFNEYYKRDAIEKFAKSKYFKKDGAVSKEFVDFILNNEYMFMNRDSYNAYPYIDTSLDLATQKDGSINYEIASLLLKTGYKYAQKLAGGFTNNSPDRIKKILAKISELCKDKSGDFNNDYIIKTIKEVKYIQERLLYYSKKTSEADIYLNEKYMNHITKDKNLYDAKVILDILNKTDINIDLLTTKIPEYENLLFAIADIPPENNPEAYKEIINKLYGLEKTNFNIKDSNGISLLEKVIMSENKELLNVISHPSNKPLEYYPELDWAYNGIQNNDFKAIVKNLNLRFVDLEESAKLCSVNAFDKLKSQLDSPLCNKSRVLQELFNIVKQQKGTVEPPDEYIYHLLYEYEAYINRDIYNEMANWQINERLKRMI